ncbi:gamma-glutamyl-gamma-aminobutyrate hydrolase family protein [Acidihalobacter prosperus]
MSVIIGISTFGPIPNGRYECPKGYPAAIDRAGGLPLPLPPIPNRMPEYLDLVDGLILIGGEDIDPTTYGAAPRKPLSRLNPHRDRAEKILAHSAVDRNLPLLAICRGMQVVNIALGGNIYSHLPDIFGEDITHVGNDWAVIPHEIHVDPQSQLRNWLGTNQFSSLSGHHQAISALGHGLRPSAWAPDGVIEAFEHETHPFLIGVQWHPELNADKDPIQQRLFNCLVSAAQRYKEHH